MYFKSKKDKKSLLVGTILMSVLAFFSIRYMQNAYFDNIVEYVFFLLPVIGAIFGWFMFLTGRTPEDDEDEIFKNH